MWGSYQLLFEDPLSYRVFTWTQLGRVLSGVAWSSRVHVSVILRNLIPSHLQFYFFHLFIDGDPRSCSCAPAKSTLDLAADRLPATIGWEPSRGGRAHRRA